jgi:hypothetical protein
MGLGICWGGLRYFVCWVWIGCGVAEWIRGARNGIIWVLETVRKGGCCLGKLLNGGLVRRFGGTRGSF